jgi:steroid delta-isomerase-like uncharacterized protein
VVPAAECPAGTAGLRFSSKLGRVEKANHERGTSKKEADLMTTKAEKMLRDWNEAWNAHEVESILSYFTDDIVFKDLGGARVMRGKAQMRTWIDETLSAFPDFRTDLKSLFVSGKWAGSEWVASGTLKGRLHHLQPTGKGYSVRGASIMELRDGKIKRNTDFYDSATMIRQLFLT